MRRGTARLGAVIAALLLAGGLAVAVESQPTDDAVASTSRRQVSSFEPRPAPLRGAAPSPSPVVRAAHRGEPVVAELRTHDSCASLLRELRERALPLVTAYGLPLYGGPGGGTAVADSGSSAGAAQGSGGGSGSAPPAFSTTNVQEGGVDEPDIVKNDANRMFTLFDGTLRALVIDDGRPIVRDTLALPGVHDLLLVGDRVVAVGNDHQADRQGSRFFVVDVRDPSDLRVAAEITTEGSYLSARSVGDSIRVVTSQGGPTLDFVHPQSPDDEARTLAENRRIIVQSKVADWLPDTTTCDDAYTPQQFAGLTSTTVLTIDPRAGTVVDSATIVADAGEVYATPSNLYVASWPFVPIGDGTAPAATHIHRFDISDPVRTVYEASGVVPGHLLRPFAWGGGGMGQWSLSEHGDVLRVATTVGESWGSAPASQSGITVLRVDGRALVPVGAVTGLGVGERIYAVRFMGPLGYVVTYRRTDPLYVVDLADPTAPRVLGELKVPGYSAYLHPIGDGRLLGIGQDDPDEDGIVDGTQASLFDVSDPAAPQRLSHLSFGDRGTSSAVEHDHRAFTWWADPARAVLPLTSWDGTSDSFVGVVALGVEGDELVEVGRLSHAHPSDERCAVPIERSRVIGDALLTFSAAGVAVHAIDDLDRRSEVAYDDVHPGWCPDHVEEPPTTTTTTTTTTLLPVEPERD